MHTKKYPSFKVAFELKKIGRSELRLAKNHYNKFLRGSLRKTELGLNFEDQTGSISVTLSPQLEGFVDKTVRILQPCTVDRQGTSTLHIEFKEDVRIQDQRYAPGQQDQRLLKAAEQCIKANDLRTASELLHMIPGDSTQKLAVYRIIYKQLFYFQRYLQCMFKLIQRDPSEEYQKELVKFIINHSLIEDVPRAAQRLSHKFKELLSIYSNNYSNIPNKLPISVTAVINQQKGAKLERFTSPKIQVRECSDKIKGFGMFAKTELAAGQVIFIDQSYVRQIIINQEKKATPFSQLVFDELYQRPGKAQRLTWLEGPTNSSKQPWDRPKQFNNRFQMDYISQLLPKIQFQFSSIDCVVFPGVSTNTGLFPTFCLFNHSCCQNVQYMIVKDFMVARTFTTVNPGQQLTVSYINSNCSKQQRNKYLSKLKIDKCLCECCKQFQQLTVKQSQRIESLSFTIQKFLNEIRTELSKKTSKSIGYEMRSNQLAKQLNIIKKEDCNTNVKVFKNFIYFMLVIFQVKNSNIEKAVKYFFQFVEEAHVDDCVSILLLLIDCYQMIKTHSSVEILGLDVLQNKFKSLGLTKSNIKKLMQLNNKNKSQIQNMKLQKISL